MERVYLCNSGTEAIEAALKFARYATGRTHILAFMRGFHGRTMGALSATYEPKYREPFMPLVPDFAHVPYDNLAKADAAITEQTAGVIVEIVQGEGGVRPGSAAYDTCINRAASAYDRDQPGLATAEAARVSDARNSIGCYLDFYNRRRPHSSLDGSTPDQAYFTSLPIRIAA